jgi:recombination protein RecA
MAKKKPPVEVDENEGLIAKLRSIAPKGEAAAAGWEVSRTTDLVLSEVKYVITTGIKSFDDIAGGIPVGRMGELYGLESCGKTAMAIRCAARAMRGHVREVIRDAQGNVTFRDLKPEEVKVVVAYIDNEGSLDDDDKLSVDGEKLDVVGSRFDTTDDVFKAIDGAISYQTDTRLPAQEKDGILRIMLIVVDTIASTSTKQELEQKWGAQDYPRQPQQISRALRQLVRPVNRYQVAVLFTNQVRIKFQGGQAQSGGKQTFAIQADDYTSVGGMALRFYASHRVFMYAFNQKYKLVPDAQFSAGLLVGFHTKKNRLRPPLRDGRMVLLFDKQQGGLNDVFSMLETLVFLHFVEVGAETRHTDYTLKFKSNNIVPTTFDPAKVESTLEEDEDLPASRRGSSRKDPGFKYRSEWPQFYADHKADIDKLWEAAMVYAMATEGLEGGVQVEEETVRHIEED